MRDDLEDRIIVENGELFDGTREQFMNCFFSNADDDEIKNWCSGYGWSLKINNEIIISPINSFH